MSDKVEDLLATVRFGAHDDAMLAADRVLQVVRNIRSLRDECSAGRMTPFSAIVGVGAILNTVDLPASPPPLPAVPRPKDAS